MLKPKRKNSLIRRVIISVTLANLVFWCVACGFAAFVMYNEYGESFDGTLQVTAERLLPLALSDVRANTTNSDLLVKTDNYSTPKEYTTYQVLDRNGTLLMRSEDAPSHPYGVALETGFFKTVKYRIYSLKSVDGAYIIQVADKLSERREAAREALTALLIPAILLIPFSVIAIIFMLKKQLLPIRYLSSIIAGKDTGNMQPINGGDMPSEFLPIINSVNSLMERLKAALDAERSFTSNSAHEIRTPIAAALAHTQVLIEETPECYHGRAREVEASLQRLRRLSEKLLQLARAEARVGMSEKPVDLIPYIKAVIDDYIRVAHYNERLNVIYQTESLNYHFNGDAFSIIIRNLVENALHYSPANSVVSVVVETRQIFVINDCGVIEAEKLARLGQRFYRADDHQEGSGLGLSIVNAIAQSMHIEMTYESPARGQLRGFQAIIKIPDTIA